MSWQVFNTYWIWVTLTYIFKVIWVKNPQNWVILGLICMINHRVNFSPMAFKLGGNIVHIGKFNISSGFFWNSKIKKNDGFRNLGPISHFTSVNVLVHALSQKPLLGISPNWGVYPAKFSTPIDCGWTWPSSSRSFGLKTLKIRPFYNWGCAYRKHVDALIGGFTCRTGSVGGAYFYCLKLIGWLIIIW